jgi:hypothetical protein
LHCALSHFAFSPPGPCHFNKEQTPPGDLLDPSPRIHGGCFGVLGTPPPKPLIFKSWSNRSGALFIDRWANPAGGKPRLSCASIRLVLSDIIKTSLDYDSQSVHLSLLLFITVSGEQKTLLTRGKQGEEIFIGFVTCLPPDNPYSLRSFARRTNWVA